MLKVKNLSVSEIRKMSGDLEPIDDAKLALEKASTMLSDITSLASIVMLPRSRQKSLRQVEFLPLNDNRVLAILVLNSREVQNRIIQTSRKYSASELEQAANYLNHAFAGKNLNKVREKLLAEMSHVREEMDQMMQAVIEITQLAFEDSDSCDDLLVNGQTNLMGVNELSDMGRLKHLFDAFNQKRDILHLLDQALKARGVQIFIGEESGYEPLDNCSVVTSTYGADGEVLGVLGVVGPTRMEYERVIPIVDMTAKILGTVLKSQA
jgi:heat-inducible transcriptional repressor